MKISKPYVVRGLAGGLMGVVGFLVLFPSDSQILNAISGAVLGAALFIALHLPDIQRKEVER
jgi:zinc transporter ZupT